MLNGRHYFIKFILNCDLKTRLTPEVRFNSNLVFINGDLDTKNKKYCYNVYASMIPSFEQFCEILEDYESQGRFLVINNTTDSDKLNERVFWYKPEERGDFTVGKSQLSNNLA